MMTKKITFFIVCLFLCFFGFAQKTDNHDANGERVYYVKIETSHGDMVVKLYNETPKHRDNFVKLVQEGVYNDLLFHRVIKEFMIQGGDPNSRQAKPGQMLGEGGLGYTIPAEFVPSGRPGEPDERVVGLPVLYCARQQVERGPAEDGGTAYGQELYEGTGRGVCHSGRHPVPGRRLYGVRRGGGRPGSGRQDCCRALRT